LLNNRHKYHWLSRYFFFNFILKGYLIEIKFSNLSLNNKLMYCMGMAELKVTTASIGLKSRIS